MSSKKPANITIKSSGDVEMGALELILWRIAGSIGNLRKRGEIMFGFLKGLFDTRCILAGSCDGYSGDSFTCNVCQKKGDGGVYCGKLRSYLDSKTS